VCVCVCVCVTFIHLSVDRHLDWLPRWLSDKESACNAGDAGDAGLSLGWEDPMEEEMATHSSTLIWKIPWTEEPCRLQSMGLQRTEYD